MYKSFLYEFIHLSILTVRNVKLVRIVLNVVRKLELAAAFFARVSYCTGIKIGFNFVILGSWCEENKLILLLTFVAEEELGTFYFHEFLKFILQIPFNFLPSIMSTQKYVALRKL